MEDFLEAVLLYKTSNQRVIASYWRVYQAIFDVGEQLNIWRPVQKTGSMFEGMPNEACNDQDSLLTYRDFPIVISRINATPEKELNGLIPHSVNNGQPAFVMLKPNNIDMLDKLVAESINAQGFVEGGLLITNIKHDNDDVHGPAMRHDLFPGFPDIGELDDVLSLSCPEWPQCASSFLTRATLSGWPSSTLRTTIELKGCHIVPVGMPGSSTSHMEWRWSFSMAERELLHNISHSMYACMFAMEMILNVHWEKDEQWPVKVICSYYLKTVCLWLSEELVCADMKIINLVNVLLDRLIYCYRGKSLSHYFIPEQNLIGHLNDEMCEKVCNWLMDVKNNIFVKCLSSVNICSHLDDVVCELFQSFNVPIPINDEEFDIPALYNAIVGCDKSDELLIDMADKIKPGSAAYEQWRRYGLAEYSTFSDNCIFESLVTQLKHVPEKVSLSSFITIPQHMLEPVIHNINTIVLKPYGVMFQKSLYRHLGDCYHSLAAYLQNINKDLYMICYKKSIEFYILGKEIVHPDDGWSDKGLVGVVLLAKLYYLSQQWKELNIVLNELQPLLEEAAESKEFQTGLSDINILQVDQLPTSPWEQDVEMFAKLLSRWNDVNMLLNPIIVGYYIIARCAIRERNNDRVETVINQMNKCLGKITDSDQIESSKILIEIVQSCYSIST